ncbi:MAG: isoprenylcysteine carboxylmethyltransferase family protein [Bacteroidetes bacterium]|nr:isoprenylcysteine carboxylmethyltransferase family protein [Bacteroidota bacterium]
MKLGTKDIVYVSLQFILFVLYLFNPIILKIVFPFWLHYLGIILSILGLLIAVFAVLQLNKNLSPFPTPVDGSKLIKTGLYKYIRHPIYTGIIVGAYGFALYTDSGSRLSIAILLYILFHYKSNYEEGRLISAFAEYPQYMQSTGKFFPKKGK